MKALFTWKRLALLATTLIIISLSVVLALAVQFNRTIQDGLKNRKFLPPTTYYSAAETISLQQALNQEELIAQFRRRNYRELGPDARLHAGEYMQMSGALCKEQSGLEFDADPHACVIYRIHESLDPELANLGPQLASFDEQGKLLHLAQGNPLTLSTAVFLEPEIIAQYLGHEPIQQEYLPLGQIPTQCLNAVIAIEDSSFLEHKGVSFQGLMRAVYRNVFQGRREGGSTITQQLVKNYYLSSERTLRRKINEFIMSIILEAHASKDDILETYLNIIYLGQNGPFQIRGFPAASRYYFRKPIHELNTAECALLAAVLNSPGLFDPFRKAERALQRRNLVLERMLSLRLISDEEKQKFVSIPLPRPRQISVVETAPYYIDAVKKDLQELGLLDQGLTIFTGLKLRAQDLAQKSVQESLADLESRNKKIAEIKKSGKALEAVLLSADNATGMITAIVGGRGYKQTQFNRAIEGHRQVGSIMKPFVYLAALEEAENGDANYDPLTLLKDESFTFKFDQKSWKPENYGKKYYGEVPMYFALKNSLNAATVTLGLEVGLPKIISVAERAGVTSSLSPLPSLILGSFELYPKEVLQSYMTLAGLGVAKKLSTLRSVLSSEGKPLYRHQIELKSALPLNATAQTVMMMKQTILSGTAQQLLAQGFTRPAAGKTGTTSDYRDAWFAGFTPFVSTVVWVGYDDNTAHGLTGASGALPIWSRFMKGYATRFPEQDFAWPDELEHRFHTEEGEPPRQVELLFR